MPLGQQPHMRYRLHLRFALIRSDASPIAFNPLLTESNLFTPVDIHSTLALLTVRLTSAYQTGVYIEIGGGGGIRTRVFRAFQSKVYYHSQLNYL